MHVKINNPSELLNLRDEYDSLTIEFAQPLKRARILNIKANKLFVKGRCEKLKINFTTAIEINTESSIFNVDISNNFLLETFNGKSITQPSNITILHDFTFDESNADSLRKLIVQPKVALLRCDFSTKVDLSGCNIKTIYADDSAIQSLSLDFNFGLKIINFYGKERHYSFFGCGNEIEQIRDEQIDNSMSALSVSSAISRKHGILMDGIFNREQLIDQSNIILYIVNFIGDIDLHNLDVSELYIYKSKIGKLDIRGCKISVFYSENSIEKLVDGIIDISNFNIFEINRYNFNDFYEQSLLLSPTIDTFVFRDISIGGDTLKKKLKSYNQINTIIFKGSISLGSSDLSNLDKRVIIFDHCFNNPNASLNISNNQVIFDSSSFMQLKSLILSNCNVDNVDIDYNNRIKQLIVDHNNLSNFDGSRFDELEELDVSYNKIKTINLPFKLRFLDCSHNNINKLICNVDKLNTSFNVDLKSFNGSHDLKRIVSKGYRTSDFYMTKLYSSLYRGFVDLRSTNEILVPSSSYSVDINTDKKIIKFIPESFDSSLSFVAINSDTVEEIYMSDLGVEKVFLKTPNLKRFDAENGNLTNVEINENIEILNLSGNSQPITINEQRSYSVSFFIYENSPDLPKLLKYKPSFKEEMFKNIAPDYGEPNSFSFDYDESAIPHIYSVIQEPAVLDRPPVCQFNQDQTAITINETMKEQSVIALNESEVDHETMVDQEQSVIDLSEPMKEEPNDEKLLISHESMKDQLLVDVGELLKTIDNEQLVRSLVEFDDEQSLIAHKQSDRLEVDHEQSLIIYEQSVQEQSLIDLNESMKKVEELSNKFKEMIENQNADDCLESNIYDQIVDNETNVDQDPEIYEPIIEPKKIEAIKPVTKAFLIDDVQLEMTNANEQSQVDHDQPVVINDQSMAVNEEPLINEQSVIVDQPLIIAEQPSSTNDQPVIDNEKSQISHIFTIKFII